MTAIQRGTGQILQPEGLERENLDLRASQLPPSSRLAGTAARIWTGWILLTPKLECKLNRC